MVENYTEAYIGCDCLIEDLKFYTDKINQRVVEKINGTQELVMVNDFARETNENILKKCLQDRIADISSWRWVLEDLTKRIDASVVGLNHELKAIKVIIRRLEEEIEENKKSMPGILCPKKDLVEGAIREETEFLHEQKNVFEELGRAMEEQIKSLEKTKNKIKADILNKDETITLEEGVAGINLKTIGSIERKKINKKKCVSLDDWENRCLALKQDGLKALSHSLLARQQVRGARLQLTMASQTCANKVDRALKRRLHVNETKLEEMLWRNEEIEKDMESLKEEQMNTEQSLLMNMEQQKVIEARLADRTMRPNGEHTEDEVDERLKHELARVRKSIQDLRFNLDEIISLQNHLTETVSKIDFFITDICEIIRLDKERMMIRLGNVPPPMPSTSMRSMSTERSSTTTTTLDTIKRPSELRSNQQSNVGSSVMIPATKDQLQTIKEEDEADENVGNDEADENINNDEFDENIGNVRFSIDEGDRDSESIDDDRNAKDYQDADDYDDYPFED